MVDDRLDRLLLELCSAAAIEDRDAVLQMRAVRVGEHQVWLDLTEDGESLVLHIVFPWPDAMETSLDAVAVAIATHAFDALTEPMPVQFALTPDTEELMAALRVPLAEVGSGRDLREWVMDATQILTGAHAELLANAALEEETFDDGGDDNDHGSQTQAPPAALSLQLV